LPVNLVADHTIITSLISQRLVKVLCPHCSRALVDTPGALPPEMYARVRQAVGGALPRVRVTGDGCEHCAMQGTVGRSVLAEVIVPDDQFFKYIRAGDKCAAVRHWIENLDGRLMLGHAIDKIAAGQLDPRMAEKVVGHLTIVPALAAATYWREAVHAA